MPKNKLMWHGLPKPDDPDWKDVCSQFYHACGGMLGCGDVDAVEDLIIQWQLYFEEEE